MKKFTLIALAIMASATSFAQTILWNGENTEITNRNDNAGFWGDGSPVLTDNTQKEGINTSDKCIKFVAKNGGTTIKLPFGEWMQPSMDGSTRVSFMIKKTGTENVLVELSNPTDGSAEYWKHTAKWFEGDNNWHKLVFDFSSNGEFDKPGLMSITVNNNGDDVDVYIDNIVIEAAPRINGKLFSEWDGKITGKVELTGAWMKGDCKNTDNVNDWKDVFYNDYEYFYQNADDAVTSVDLRKAQASDVDVNQFFQNTNTIVYANEAYKHSNVVVNGIANNVELTDAKAFNCPEDFTAEKVTLTRNLQEGDKGINSFVLPFKVNKEELKSTSLATYSSADNNEVVFTKVTEVDANTPFITVGYNKGEGEENKLTWNDKGFVATPTEFNDAFKGVYAAKDAEGRLYGINDKGELQKGAAGKFIKPFHAYYEATEGQTIPAKISFEGEATGINSVAATTVANGAVYDLSGRRVAEKLAGASLVKGIYVVNGKKVVVK